MDGRAIARIPLEAARWLLLANIVLAAWLYGGTREWTREWVAWLLVGNSGLFLVGLLCRWKVPRIPWMPTLAGIFLLGQGWVLTWNAERIFLKSGEVFVLRPFRPLPDWPGFLEQGLVIPGMILTTGLLGAFAIACDLSANRVWRDRLWMTIAGTGFSIVLLGLAQRFTEAPAIFWDVDRNLGGTFFGVFRYHANAGAFMNLVLPLMVALGIRGFARGGSEAARVFWTLAALTTAAAGFVNVSRAANMICALLIVGMGAWIWFSVVPKKGGRGFPVLAGVTLLAAACLLLAFSFGLEKTLLRWELGFWKEGPADTGRYRAYEIIVRGALPEAGPFGSGPGSFEPLFNLHRAKLGDPLEGRWDKAHSDALQTPMEWGWAGTAAWAVILIGGFGRALGRVAGQGSPESKILPAACVFSLGSVLVHAMVDFPMQIASIQLFTLAIAGLAWGNRSRQSACHGDQ
jgi:hypothetical protein